MYFVVEVFSFDESKVKRFVDDWQKHVKYSLPREVKREILIEGRAGKYMYLLVIRGALLGLWIVLKLMDLGQKHRVSVNVRESTSVIIDERYIDKAIRERIEKIPPHLVYEVRRVLLERRLPRGRRREIIEAMKQ